MTKSNVIRISDKVPLLEWELIEKFKSAKSSYRLSLNASGEAQLAPNPKETK